MSTETFDDGFTVSGPTMEDEEEEGSWGDGDTVTGNQQNTGNGPTGSITEPVIVEEGSWDDEENGNTDTENVPANPPEIGEAGCFANMLRRQSNPSTQSAKFLGYQVAKQEEAAHTTKLFAFGSFK